MDSSVAPKGEIWFLRMCHHISNAVYLVLKLLNDVNVALFLDSPQLYAVCQYLFVQHQLIVYRQGRACSHEPIHFIVCIYTVDRNNHVMTQIRARWVNWHTSEGPGCEYGGTQYPWDVLLWL